MDTLLHSGTKQSFNICHRSHEQHIPPFIKNYEQIKAKGVDVRARRLMVVIAL